MGYRNVDNWVVISVDNRNPHTSFTNHRVRGSLGGVDCVAPIGRPIHAPADAKAHTGIAGTGGRTVTLTYPDGWQDQFMHLSRYAFEAVSAHPVSVRQGDPIGYSGASGIDSVGRLVENYYAPHVHWHRVDPAGLRNDAWGSTNRRVPWDYFTSDTGTAGGGVIPITPIEEDDLATVTDAQWNALYDATMQIRDALGAQGGLNTKAADSVLGIVRTLPKTIPAPPTPADVAKAIWTDSTIKHYLADGKTVEPVSVIQDIANIATGVAAANVALASLKAGGIDVDKLADAIVAKLPAQADQVDVAGIVRAELARVFVAAAG